MVQRLVPQSSVPEVLVRQNYVPRDFVLRNFLVTVVWHTISARKFRAGEFRATSIHQYTLHCLSTNPYYYSTLFHKKTREVLLATTSELSSRSRNYRTTRFRPTTPSRDIDLNYRRPGFPHCLAIMVIVPLSVHRAYFQLVQQWGRHWAHLTGSSRRKRSGSKLVDPWK